MITFPARPLHLPNTQRLVPSFSCVQGGGASPTVAWLFPCAQFPRLVHVSSQLTQKVQQHLYGAGETCCLVVVDWCQHYGHTALRPKHSDPGGTARSGHTAPATQPCSDPGRAASSGLEAWKPGCLTAKASPGVLRVFQGLPHCD